MLHPCNLQRCRTLYGRYLEFAPANCAAWAKFAELERSLGEAERARAIYELAIGQPVLDMPELLWKVCACRRWGGLQDLGGGQCQTLCARRFSAAR